MYKKLIAFNTSNTNLDISLCICIIIFLGEYFDKVVLFRCDSTIYVRLFIAFTLCIVVHHVVRR